MMARPAVALRLTDPVTSRKVDTTSEDELKHCTAFKAQAAARTRNGLIIATYMPIAAGWNAVQLCAETPSNEDSATMACAGSSVR
jgi:hypothetical protein